MVRFRRMQTFRLATSNHRRRPKSPMHSPDHPPGPDRKKLAAKGQFKAALRRYRVMNDANRRRIYLADLA